MPETFGISIHGCMDRFSSNLSTVQLQAVLIGLGFDSTEVNSAFLPSGVGKLSTGLLGWG